MGNFITTYTGRHFEPANPDPDAIVIEDIAHALSLITRGNGHVKTFWSVGEHCLCCAKEAAARGLSGRMVLACLLHDASECYMSDIPRPFKKELPEYREHSGGQQKEHRNDNIGCAESRNPLRNTRQELSRVRSRQQRLPTENLAFSFSHPVMNGMAVRTTHAKQNEKCIHSPEETTPREQFTYPLLPSRHFAVAWISKATRQCHDSAYRHVNQTCNKQQ